MSLETLEVSTESSARLSVRNLKVTSGKLDSSTLVNIAKNRVALIYNVLERITLYRTALRHVFSEIVHSTSSKHSVYENESIGSLCILVNSQRIAWEQVDPGPPENRGYVIRAREESNYLRYVRISVNFFNFTIHEES